MERTKRMNPMNESKNGFLLPSVVGGLAGLGVTVALLLALPFLILGFEDPNAFVLPTVCISVLVGNTVGGFISSIKCKENAFAAVLTAFAVFILPTVLISFFISGAPGVVSVIAVMLSAAVGNGLAFFAVSKFSKSKKRKMKSVMKRR